MTRREPKPTGRKIKVRWTTEEWKPAIQFARQTRNGVRALDAVLDPVSFRIERQRKRKIEPELWVRAGGRIGSRSTWR